MELVGISVKLDYNKNVTVEIDYDEVVKETPKMYKLKKGSCLVFNCLSQISKDDIGVIQNGSIGNGKRERRIWLINEDVNVEQEVKKLKQVLLDYVENQINELQQWKEQLMQ